MDKSFLERLIKGIAAQFGEKCEVVLHDFSKGYDETIVAIENSHITGRSVGGCLTNLGVENLQKGNGRDHLCYIGTTDDGKVLKSSTILIKDEQGKPTGSICINFDISDFIVAESAIRNILPAKPSSEEHEIFVKDISALMDHYFQECQRIVGKPVSLMTKEDRLEALRFLDEKGVFLITKSGNRACDFFNISKYTLYSQLDAIRKGKKD